MSCTRPSPIFRLPRKQFARWFTRLIRRCFFPMQSGQMYRHASLLLLAVGLAIRSIPVLAQEVKSGSGFIFHPDGYILTNNHVVADSTEQIVVLANGNRIPAKLVATDQKTDA